MEIPKKRKVGESGKAPTRLKKIRRDESNKPSSQTKKNQEKPVYSDEMLKKKPTTHDAFLAQEEREIARLEKLLGIKESGKGRKKCAAKLNKEYEMYEGMDGNFGDFLMELDDLTDMIAGKNKKDRVFAKSNAETDDKEEDDESPEEIHVVGHCIDDDAQEQSDIDDNDDDDDDGEPSDDDGTENEEEEDERDDEDDDVNDEDDDDDGNDDGDDDDDDDDDAVSDRQGGTHLNNHEYRPIQGEDIYGRIKNDDQTGATATKYVAPARRKQLLTTIDESSEQVKVIRKSMRGIMNRLSDQTKDATARAMKVYHRPHRHHRHHHHPRYILMPTFLHTLSCPLSHFCTPSYPLTIILITFRTTLVWNDPSYDGGNLRREQYECDTLSSLLPHSKPP